MSCYLNRLHKLYQQLPQFSCEALLIEHPTNLLYLTGLELSAGKLIVFENESVLLVDGRYIETSRKNAVCTVYLIDEMPLKDVLAARNIKRLGFESDKTTYQSYINLQQQLQSLTPHPCELVPVEAPIQNLRLIKDEAEIELLTQAAQLNVAGYQLITCLLKEGVKESDLALELEFFWKKQGAKKLSFDPIIAFGANGSMPHYRAGSTVLKKDTSVLIDIGVTWQHYQSDMTRVVFFGSPSDQIKEIYDIVEEAKQRAMALCKPGTLIGELDQAARQWITHKGYGEFFTHSLGHGVGLDIHETPVIRSKGPFSQQPLQAGMVITIEPGIYLPNKGGVRLEDTILITPSGYKILTVI